MGARTLVENAFAQTLPGPERRLAARLEGFGDIVFGFAISQCALQLPTVRGHVDLARPLGLLLYFATFALLATLWLTYHRLMSGAFKPTRFDLGIAFAYLALVSLMPYAMYSISHVTLLADARTALAEYTILYAGMMGLAAFLTIRNFRRGWLTLDDAGRDRTWATFVRQCIVCVMMMLALAVDIVFGPNATIYPFSGIAVALRIAGARLKNVPAAAASRMNASV
jgi:uncharacterized membrane protein